MSRRTSAGRLGHAVAGQPNHQFHRLLVGQGVGGRVIEAGAGSFVYGPRDVPHTFVVTSPQARFLLVTEPAGFESFMRAVAEPAGALEIPPPASEPPDFEQLAALAAEYGIEILGPPGIPG